MAGFLILLWFPSPFVVISVRLIFLSSTKIPIHYPALELVVTTSVRHKKLRTNKFSEFNFRKCNLSLLYSALQNVEWSFLCDGQGADAAGAVLSFYSVLNDVFEHYVPLMKSKANGYPSFFDSNVIKTLKLKDYGRKRYKSSGATVDCESFKAMRSKFKADVKTAYSSYVQRMNNDIQSNPRQFWIFINDKKKSNFILS
jgi:hypothetical protein